MVLGRIQLHGSQGYPQQYVAGTHNFIQLGEWRGNIAQSFLSKLSKQHEHADQNLT